MSNSIFIADDHPIVRQGMKNLFRTEPGFTVVGDAGNGLEVVQMVERLKPDLLLVDLMMPGLNGLEVIRQVRERSPRTRIVVLSMHSAEAYVIDALKNGALGYILKDSEPVELLSAVREALNGRRYLSTPLSQKLIEAFLHAPLDLSADPYESLTNREREIFQLAAEGHSNAEIAQMLTISPRTAEIHRARMMEKLSLHSQIDLIRCALKRGVLSLEG